MIYMMIESAVITVLIMLVLFMIQAGRAEEILTVSGFQVPCNSVSNDNTLVLNSYCKYDEMTTVWHDVTGETEERSLYITCDMENGKTMGNVIKDEISQSGEKTIVRPAGSVSCQITACYSDALYNPKLSLSNVCFFDDEMINDTMSSVIEPSSTYIDSIDFTVFSSSISPFSSSLPLTSLSATLSTSAVYFISSSSYSSTLLAESFSSFPSLLSQSNSVSITTATTIINHYSSIPIDISTTIDPYHYSTRNDLISTAASPTLLPSNALLPQAFTIQFTFQLSENDSCHGLHIKFNSLPVELINIISSQNSEITLQDSYYNCISLLHQYQLKLHVLSSYNLDTLKTTLLNLIYQRQLTKGINEEWSVQYMCVLIGNELLSCFELNYTPKSTISYNTSTSTTSTHSYSTIKPTTSSTSHYYHDSSLHLQSTSKTIDTIVSISKVINVTTPTLILSSSSPQSFTVTSIVVIISVGVVLGVSLIIAVILLLIVIIFHRRKTIKQYDLEMKQTI